MKKILKSIVLIAGLAVATPQVYAQVSVGISISANIAPPALPVYTQPACPNDGYIWTPGYWAYADPDGYYWVPGVWVSPPRYGVLWTPSYWGFEGGVYGFHAGYWGPHVGFYGGINYGYGYGGVGFGGGVWAGNSFRYNTAVANVNTTVIHNTYVNNTVINNNTTVNRTSFNGQGGIQARPNEQERTAMNERHVQPTSNQVSHQANASHDRSQFASANHGTPHTAAMNEVGGRKFDQQGRAANGSHPGNPGNDQQNKNSNAIAADKHNANNVHSGNNPAANQQQRIAQGQRNGQMNAGQPAHAENHQQNINRNVHADRQANNGNLNRQQPRQVSHQQNHASRPAGHPHHG
ncbi:YXWGXW repeat-containing protein [Mucilaginibacter sp. FT3.2]|uniref:YXWGXW repeat-containing protein n=1 Tax=Mucilaginibacter sp. FT3.2 TaxID=2723090 RepID=UPI00160A0173|nr:YXWGXW repeat-containing protein [Mucilaginibacter sp. FT3.2]MBB6231927.1 hypothetical protein [Mucilaginibacter sp. FT3.2]